MYVYVYVYRIVVAVVVCMHLRLESAFCSNAILVCPKVLIVRNSLYTINFAD